MGQPTKIGELYKPDFQEINWDDEVNRNFDRIANGIATTNYDIAKGRDLVQLKERSQIVNLAGGQHSIHGFVIANNTRIFATTRTSPAWCIRFNNLNDLADRTALQFASDGKHNRADSCVYVTEVNRLYAVFDSSGGTITVSEVHPDTLAVTDVITITAGGILPVIASDGTNLYIGTYESPARIFKYRISDFSAQGNVTVTGRNQIHAMVFDGDRLYATGTQTTPAWVARINHTTMTVEQDAGMPTGVNILTDDLCSVGDYLWCGREEVNTQGLFKIEKATLAVEHIRTPGSSSVIFAVYYDGQWVWVAHDTAPATLTRVDPGSGQAYTHTFPSGENTINEIVSDGRRLFVTFWNQDPGKVKRLVPPYLGSPSLPVTAYSVNPTAISNTGNPFPLSIRSYQLGGGFLIPTLATFRVTASGRFAATDTLKRLYFEWSTRFFDTAMLPFKDCQWWLDALCVSTGADAQKWMVRWNSDSPLLPVDIVHATTNLQAVSPQTIIIGGQADASGEITVESFLVEAVK